MTPRLAQLYAVRAQIDALIMAEEGELQQTEVSAGCSHPDNKRVDATTGGGPRKFLCLACNQEVLGAA